jgi:hypothetical protein
MSMTRQILERGLLPLVLLLLVASAARAQEGPSYNLEEHVLNAGGNPAQGTSLSSANYAISVDAIGDALVARGLSSSSYRLDAGFVTAYPPPGEVWNLRLLDASTLRWDPEPSAGTYRLYRGLASELPGLGYGDCERQGLTTTTTSDADPAPVGEAFFYLVTVANRLEDEGTKGHATGGDEREGSVCF